MEQHYPPRNNGMLNKKKKSFIKYELFVNEDDQTKMILLDFTFLYLRYSLRSTIILNSVKSIRCSLF